MANTVKLPRNYLVMGLCLPLAVLLGYILAEPLETSSMAVVVLVLTVLCVPLLMKWHHPLMVLCWNAVVSPAFFPGHLDLWVMATLTGFFFAVLNRSVDPNFRFIHAPTITKPLIAIFVVVIGTALLTGGFGMQ